MSEHEYETDQYPRSIIERVCDAWCAIKRACKQAMCRHVHVRTTLQSINHLDDTVTSENVTSCIDCNKELLREPIPNGMR